MKKFLKITGILSAIALGILNTGSILTVALGVTVIIGLGVIYYELFLDKKSKFYYKDLLKDE